MMKEPSHRVSIAFFVITLVLIIGLKAEAQTKTNTRTLTLGIVFQGAREPLEAHFRPLVDYAARKRAKVCFERLDRKSTRLNSSHTVLSRMPSSA